MIWPFLTMVFFLDFCSWSFFTGMSSRDGNTNGLIKAGTPLANSIRKKTIIDQESRTTSYLTITSYEIYIVFEKWKIEKRKMM